MTMIQVDPGDPHNDQMLALTAEDLTAHMASVRHVLDQAEEFDAPLSAITAVIASKWIIDEEDMPRERLASLLALAIIRLQAHIVQQENAEVSEFFKNLRGHDVATQKEN